MHWTQLMLQLLRSQFLYSCILSFMFLNLGEWCGCGVEVPEVPPMIKTCFPASLLYFCCWAIVAFTSKNSCVFFSYTCVISCVLKSLMLLICEVVMEISSGLGNPRPYWRQDPYCRVHEFWRYFNADNCVLEFSHLRVLLSEEISDIGCLLWGIRSLIVCFDCEGW